MLISRLSLATLLFCAAATLTSAAPQADTVDSSLDASDSYGAGADTVSDAASDDGVVDPATDFLSDLDYFTNDQAEEEADIMALATDIVDRPANEATKGAVPALLARISTYNLLNNLGLVHPDCRISPTTLACTMEAALPIKPRDIKTLVTVMSNYGMVEMENVRDESPDVDGGYVVGYGPGCGNIDGKSSRLEDEDPPMAVDMEGKECVRVVIRPLGGNSGGGKKTKGKGKGRGKSVEDASAGDDAPEFPPLPSPKDADSPTDGAEGGLSTPPDASGSPPTDTDAATPGADAASSDSAGGLPPTPDSKKGSDASSSLPPAPDSAGGLPPSPDGAKGPEAAGGLPPAPDAGSAPGDTTSPGGAPKDPASPDGAPKDSTDAGTEAPA